jgi:pSer/pThr/pTyr-binding forkhead associated (FHA) protein
MFKLVISDDEGKTTVVPLVRDEITIGRKEGNTIRLTERNVSRKHARLFKANGAFTIEDLSSYNGIKVNGRKIGEPASLKAGDQVTIGDYLLALQVDAAENMTEPTTPIAAPDADAETAMIEAPGAGVEALPPARLVMLSPPAPGAEFALARPRVRFGRAEDLDAWVNHRSISREHAEVVQDDTGAYRIVDLGSANGLRVNGQDVRDAALQPGDVIEMGQVRFRFVGRGEVYTFDADRTIQMEAVPSGAGRAPMIAAAGILVVAVAIGGVIAMGGGNADDQEPIATPIEEFEPASSSPTAEAAMPSPAAAAATAEDEERYRDEVSRCRSAFENARYDEAILAAQRALAVMAGGEDAERCKVEADNAVAERQRFEEAERAYRRREYQQAWSSLADIASDSPFLVGRAADRLLSGLASASVNEAGNLVNRRRYDDARTLAQAVVDMDRRLPDRIPDQVATDAGGTLRLIQSQTRVAAAAPRERERSRTPRTTRPSRPEPAVQQPEPREPTQERATGGDPLRTCFSAPNYSRCIVDALEGRARSCRQMEALIEAYRVLGNTAARQRVIGTFVERCPNDPRARQYRQMLNR